MIKFLEVNIEGCLYDLRGRQRFHWEVTEYTNHKGEKNDKLDLIKIKSSWKDMIMKINQENIYNTNIWDFFSYCPMLLLPITDKLLARTYYYLLLTLSWNPVHCNLCFYPKVILSRFPMLWNPQNNFLALFWASFSDLGEEWPLPLGLGDYTTFLFLLSGFLPPLVFLSDTFWSLLLLLASYTQCSLGL